MSNCKKCNCKCHCKDEFHTDVYGVCPCDNCKCNSKRTYTNLKEHGTDISYENEVSKTGGVVVDDTGECDSCQ